MRDTLRRSTRILSLLLLFVVPVCATAIAHEVPVGALLPLSGSLRSHGHDVANALHLAARQINEQGGLLGGAILRVIEADDQGHPFIGVRAAASLLEEHHVVAVIGSLTSAVTVPVATAVTVPAEVLLITPGATAPEITYLDDGGWVFRTTPSDIAQGYALGHLAWELGLSRIVVAYSENIYGRALFDAFQRTYRSRGGHIEGRIAYSGDFGLNPEALPEPGEGGALVMLGYPDASSARLLSEAVAAGYTTLLLSEGLWATAREGIDGAFLEVWSVSTAAHPFHHGTERFRAAYFEAFGTEAPARYASDAYDALFLLALAIEWSGRTEGAAVRDAIPFVTDPAGEVILPGEWSKARALIAAGRTLRYEGASGRVQFDSRGDRTEAAIQIWRLDSRGERVNDHVMLIDLTF